MKKINSEQLIFDVAAASRSKSQKGDISDFAKNILSPEQVKTLKKRDKFPSGGNPIDVKKLIN